MRRFWISAWTAKLSVCLCAGRYSEGGNERGVWGIPSDITISILKDEIALPHNKHNVLLIVDGWTCCTIDIE